MKICQLFEGTRSPNDYAEWWDWIYREAMMPFNDEWPTQLKEFMANHPESKVPVFDFIQSLSMKDKDRFMNDYSYIKDITMSPEGINGVNLAIIGYKKVGPPPFKINELKQNFSLDAAGIKTLPTWLPNYARVIRIDDGEFTSLQGIDKIIKRCSLLKLIYIPIKSNILGLLNIDGLRKVEILFPEWMIESFPDQPLTEIDGIINKHLSGDRDIFECQDELVSKGLKEYAKL